MFYPRLAFLFSTLPFIHAIPYGLPNSDDTSIGAQQSSLPPLLDSNPSTDPTLDATGAMEQSNVPEVWIIADAYTLGNWYTSTSPSIPAPDTPNPTFPITDTSQPLLVSTALNDQTNIFNALENQNDNEGVSTDGSNVEGSTGTLVAFRSWRTPPPLAPADRPHFTTPNCEKQLSKDRSHEKFLSCCNFDMSQCVYFKKTHPLCNPTPRFPGPHSKFKCCADIPDEGTDGQGGPGEECLNAKNPFNVIMTPAISTPWFKVNPKKVTLPNLEPAPGPDVEVPAGGGATKPPAQILTTPPIDTPFGTIPSQSIELPQVPEPVKGGVVEPVGPIPRL